MREDEQRAGTGTEEAEFLRIALRRAHPESRNVNAINIDGAAHELRDGRAAPDFCLSNNV